MSVPLEEVAGRLESGERLTDDDVRAIGATRDIIALGQLADSARRKLHGAVVTYVRVFDVTGEAIARADVPPGAGEVRLFETPSTLDLAIEWAQTLRDRAGAVPASAFCLFELSKLPEGLAVVLPALRQAGLESVAQAPIDRLPSPERALETAGDAGLSLARLTVEETPEREWTGVCREVAAHQRRLGSIRAFAPLARKPDATQPTTGYGDVKRVALARLLAQNVDTIQVDWAIYGPKLAQVALAFGADDLDSVPAVDDTSQGMRRSTIEEVRRNIEAASFAPRERDGRFRPL